MNKKTTTCACALLALAATAQDLTPKGEKQTRPIVLKNGTIHTVSGTTIAGGTLWFRDGVLGGILERGRTPDISGGGRPEVIDLQGRHVYPGLVVTTTTIGLEEIGQVPQSVDTRELGDIKPEARAAVAFNPDSTLIPVTRSNGILTAGVFPRSGLIAGRVSVMHLDGWTWAGMSLRGDAGLAIGWPFGDGDEQLIKLDRAFDDAAAWHARKKEDPTLPTDIRWQAMGPVLERQAPVFLRADRVDQITRAVTWAVGRNLEPVIIGGQEAELCAPLLKRHGVMVVILGTHNLPKRRDSAYDERFTLPARLFEAGVRFCITGGGSNYNERNLPYHAATAVAFGLPPEEALRAITLYPAQALGVADRIGSLEVGKDATLIVTDGNPLDLTTKVELAFTRGRRAHLSNKQTELASKYRAKYREMGLIR